jgi:hypothetical protein
VYSWLSFFPPPSPLSIPVQPRPPSPLFSLTTCVTLGEWLNLSVTVIIFLSVKWVWGGTSSMEYPKDWIK